MTSISLKIPENKTTMIKKMMLIKEMSEVEKELYSIVSSSHGKTYEICTNLIKAGGKRIRPLLVLASSQCFGNLQTNAIKSAVAFELVHMASLVHDDIIDNATIRRNNPSVNIQIGSQSSVLIGDYLFAKAFEVLSKNNLNKPMELMVEAIEEMCDGEITQADNKFNLNESVDDYYNRIYKKTGILISACCQAGGIIGGANPDEINSLKVYGTNIGYAFQIVDDILDFIGNRVKIGKAVTSDLKEGNITLPIIKLIKQGEYKEWLEDITYDRNITEDKNRQVLRVLQDSYAIEETYEEATKCIEIAKDSLITLPESNFKDLLISLADNLLVRDK